MNIREMHYDFKKKFNKGDSQQNRNFLVPEIDWTLNEAANLFKKMITSPRSVSHLGFEINQRTIDDIRTIVVPGATIAVVNGLVALPNDYETFVKAEATISKGACANKKARVHPQQHDDEFEESPFDNSSFEWRTVNGVFNMNGLQLFTDGSFSINNVSLTYIRKMAYMHNAQDFGPGSYNLPSGATLTGSQDCELPAHTHPEIVDIAVALASGEVQTSDFQLRLAKLNFNQLT